MDRNLHNTDTTAARSTTSDIKVTGNPDVWELVCKASSKSQGWMKSTKRMKVPGGWLVQATTEHRFFADGHSCQGAVSGCAEALTFVPDPDHAWVVPAKE
jgi:hypothetical protein